MLQRSVSRRTPLTLEMLTMDPPSSCCCIRRFAACATCNGARRLSRMIDSVNRGEAVAVSATGEPPALLTTTSSRRSVAAISSTIAATCSGSRTSHAMKRPDVSPTGSLRPHTTTEAPAASKRGGDRSPDALRPAGDQHDSPAEIERSFHASSRSRTVSEGLSDRSAADATAAPAANRRSSPTRRVANARRKRWMR